MFTPNIVPSPPLSPLKGGDEASNFKAILESVCHTDKIGEEAISQLCKHVKADPQEKSVSDNDLCTIAVIVVFPQELLALLKDLDKDRVGYVSLDEFVRGLQFIRNAAVVASTPPPTKTASLRRARSEIIVCMNCNHRLSFQTEQLLICSIECVLSNYRCH